MNKTTIDEVKPDPEPQMLHVQSLEGYQVTQMEENINFQRKGE